MKRKREDGGEVPWLPRGLGQDPGAGRSRSRSRSRNRSRSSSPSLPGQPGPSGQPERAQLPSSSLFNLSLLKLHYGLRQVEPNLRHIVLVVNTLRRVQASMELATGPRAPPEPPAAAPEQPSAPGTQASPPASPHPPPPSHRRGPDPDGHRGRKSRTGGHPDADVVTEGHLRNTSCSGTSSPLPSTGRNTDNPPAQPPALEATVLPEKARLPRRLPSSSPQGHSHSRSDGPQNPRSPTVPAQGAADCDLHR
ncbi:uncharacterized protein LOC141500611 [Macrotis lagotis]|uniref:uncharacterized protein LOC141500611 n=1 Tax=Macrotis lagotis TaxID=92651 RepID=UPI003D69DD38